MLSQDRVFMKALESIWEISANRMSSIGGNRTQARKVYLGAACQTFMIKNPILNTLAYQLT